MLRLTRGAIDENDGHRARAVGEAHGQTRVHLEFRGTAAAILPFRRIFEKRYVKTNPVEQFFADPKFHGKPSHDPYRSRWFVQYDGTHGVEGWFSLTNLHVENPLLRRSNARGIGHMATT
jgi:hypothetical protein